MKRVLGTIAVVVCALSDLLSGDWPQWRGPQLNGTAEETNLPARWSKTEIGRASCRERV